MAKVDPNAQKALGADLVKALYRLSGNGLRIGIVSDSYNAGGTASHEVANGNLPLNLTVLSDPNSNGGDEGQAMAELIHKIAPDATLFFAGGNSDPNSDIPDIQTAADAVTALVQAGCDIVVDDLGFGISEGFYQLGTPLDLAIQRATASGVNYFSTAANDGNNYYERGFVGTETTIAGIGHGLFATFGNGTTFLNVMIPNTVSDTSDAGADFQLEWAQPFQSIGNGPGARNSLALYLLDSKGNVVASTDQYNQVDYDPTQEIIYKNTGDDTSFRLVIRQNGGIVPAGQLYKIVPDQQSAIFTDADAGTGSGSIFGHALLTGQNTVAAVDYHDTPAFGASVAKADDFTSTGPGTILFDQDGNPLATPVTTGVPAFAGVDGSSTGLDDYAPFSGTSAAAPNLAAVAALMLQANRTVVLTTAGRLTNEQLSALMAQSTVPAVQADGVDIPAVLAIGTGLVQARAAVELAAAAGGARWSNVAGGDWMLGASWASGTTPDAAAPAMVGSNLGALTDSYQVSVTTSGAVVGALTVNAAGTATTTLAIADDGMLSVGGPAQNDPTAGDLLVARGGRLLLQGGTLAVAGALNTSGGEADLMTGVATADNYAQVAGSLAVGGGGSEGGLTLTGGGLDETGGAVTVGALGRISTTSLSVSAASFTMLANSVVSASGAMTLSHGATFSTAGYAMTAAALTVDTALATVLAGGTLAVGGLLLGGSASLAGSLDIAGTVTDDGLLSATGTQQGTVTLHGGGLLSVSGGMLDVRIGFDHGGTLAVTTSDPTVLTTGLDAVLSGFDDGAGVIDFASLAYDAADTYSYQGGVFSLVRNGVAIAKLTFDEAAGHYGTFSLGSDADGHVQLQAGSVAPPSTGPTSTITPTAANLLGFTDNALNTSGALGMDTPGAGAPGYLEKQFIYAGSDSVDFATSVPNVFIRAGNGNDAIQVSSGQNVLDGGLGSNFLTGGSGTDTFFTDSRTTGVVWNTIRNFQAGDAVTLWGFTPGISSYHWEPEVAGAPGYEGATLRANIVGGSGRTGDGIDASVTLTGLSVAQAQNLQIVTGTQSAGNYLYIYNPSV